MKLYQKILLFFCILVVLLFVVYCAGWYMIGRRINECRCITIYPSISQNINKINRTLNDLDNNCLEKDLTGEETVEYTKIYKNFDDVKKIFLPKDKETKEEIACDGKYNIRFRKADDSIISCFCGK